MKELFIIGNWKSHKTLSEAREWMEFFKDKKTALDELAETQGKTVIITPPYTLLPFLYNVILEYRLPIKLCAQDISPFPEGAYTGEINGKQVKEFADYVFVGHSERRKYFNEDYEVLKNKVTQAQEYALQPIFCVQDPDTPIPPDLTFLMYEPLDAISTSGAHPLSPEQANEALQRYKEEQGIFYALYGGSVTSQNVKSYSDTPFLNGFVIGGASLNPSEFFALIQNA